MHLSLPCRPVKYARVRRLDEMYLDEYVLMDTTPSDTQENTFIGKQPIDELNNLEMSVIKRSKKQRLKATHF